jgi:uncharacterized protein YyaL (SSP411 family)
MPRYPLGFGQWLQALSYALSKPRESAIVGVPDEDDTLALLAVARDGFRPFQVIALGAPKPDEYTVPVLRDRGLVGDHAAAYVCRDLACQAPVSDEDALQLLLETG